jgi:hypothetical protein
MTLARYAKSAKVEQKNQKNQEGLSQRHGDTAKNIKSGSVI